MSTKYLWTCVCGWFIIIYECPMIRSDMTKTALRSNLAVTIKNYLTI